MNWFMRMLGERLRAGVSARRQATRLRLEELEDRWVPSTSTNWSGYAVTTNPGAVTAVSGSWVVPTVTNSSSGTNYSSAWVGIDGYNSSSVEQTGTEMDVTNGTATYSAWYEMYPSAPVTISTITVHPGDTINASVQYNSSQGNFTLSIADGSQSFTVTKSISNPQRSSAEWIVEAPSSGRGVLPLANFGTVTFTNAQATINGAAGPINNSAAAWVSAAATIQQINMVNSHGSVIDTTSGLTPDGTSFAVGFGSAPTPTPTSPPPVSPPPVSPPPVSPPPVTAIATVTSLTGTVNRYSRVPSVTFVATVSAASGSALPTGTVEVMDGSTLLGTAQIQDINGVAEVVFTVTFPPTPGVYNISVIYTGANGFAGSTSNTVTVTVY